MSHAPQCILCLGPNTTNLVLCANCEEWTRRSRERAGLPVRYAIIKEEPDTYNADD